MTAAQQIIANAQQIVQQVGVGIGHFVTNAGATVEAMNLGQYLAPVAPAFDALAVQASPFLTQAKAQVWPHIEPYLGGAKQHLDKVDQKELLIIVGGIFGGVFLLQLLLLLTSACRRGARPLKAFTPTVFWLLLCFVVHSWIEYCFVFKRTGGVSGIENGMNLYGAADFRYGFGEILELESGTASMEAITALVSGPLCLLLAWGIVGQKSWRWTVQVIVCVCQMYGLAWFMGHTLFHHEQVSSSDPFLYWVLFVGFNSPWGIIPPILLLQAVLKINQTMRKAQEAERAHTIATRSVKQVAAAQQQQQQQQGKKANK